MSVSHGVEARVDGLEQKTILLSKTEYNDTGDETVHAKITNDWAKDANGKPIFGGQYAYQMSGFQLHGPIPKEVRGGYASAEAAEKAAREEYHQWRSGNVPPETKVTRQEYWEMHYRTDRYLEHLNDDELAERIGDVMNNLMTLTHDQRIGALAIEEGGNQWMESFSHLMEECRLRRTGVPVNRGNEWHHPDYDWPGIGRAWEAFNALNVVPGQYLVKYGKFEFLKAALEKGEIRLAPASSYNRSSLNFAIKDDELSFSIHPRPVRSGLSADGVNFGGDTTEVLEAPSDYYVFCMANEFSLRLFGDFRSDACLVITKPMVFMERFAKALRLQLPLWRCEAKPVKYLDPVKATKAEIDFFFSKALRFAYQMEYRLIWKPLIPKKALPYIHVQLGNLEDCCKLISLSDPHSSSNITSST